MSKLPNQLLRALACLSLLFMARPATAQNWSFLNLHHLTGSDPRPPYRGPIVDRNGNLYFTTYGGGTHAKGAALELAPDGALTILHSFGGAGDGSYPVAGLTLDKDGNLFGTTSFGGSAGEGTVFKIAPSGAETVLYSFKGGADGQQIDNGVVKVGRNLYGTAPYGGTADCQINPHQCGIVFKILPNGTEAILHAFTGGDDGAEPYAGLAADGSGYLYGTTYYGGNGTGGCEQRGGCGTVFKIAPDGTETIVHRFEGYPTDGGNPDGALTIDSDGNLYGTTLVGGSSTSCASVGCGTIFELAPDGTETILHIFDEQVDGAAPYGSLLRDKAGEMFGTTQEGMVFELAPNGSTTAIHSFSIYKEILNPDLATDKSGNLFGTTDTAGRHPHGSVFELKRQYVRLRAGRVWNDKRQARNRW